MLICSSLPAGYLYAAHSAVAMEMHSVQQNGTCTGVVKDANGEAVIGASAVVDGTTNGTITDLDGKFSLSNVSKEVLLKSLLLGIKH